MWGVGARKSQEEEDLPGDVPGDCVELGCEWEEILPHYTPTTMKSCAPVSVGVLGLDTACSQGGFQGWEVQLIATLSTPIPVQECGTSMDPVWWRR